MASSASSGVPSSGLNWLTSGVGRVLLALVVPVITFIGLWQGFIFLRDSQAPKWVVAIVAIVWGVGGAGLIYFVSNWLIELLPTPWVRTLQPFLFVGPALAILAWFLAVPTVRTFYLSLFDRDSIGFVGLENYFKVLTDPNMLYVFRNNLLWMILGTSFTVVFGLVIAVLADRSRFETLAKSIIFMPMAISFVGAGVIWNFIYEVKDKGSEQIGLLNAIWVGLGGEPQAWTALITPPFNSLFLIVIVIWLQTGYAMVLFSAAIKGISSEVLEAARVDGANEWQVFFDIMIPQIMGTIITVTTTVVIFTLKIFDVVIVMTGGQFETSVIATEFYRQSFINRDAGVASTIAILLLVAVVPVMIYNLRSFSEREAF
jgi:alpha-glucoside transport system permease protein